MSSPRQVASCRSQAAKRSALTRIDLVALLAVMTLLGLLAWPVLAQPRSGSQQAVCVGNLRSIGQAFQLWGDEHLDVLPWRVSLGNGGTMTSGKLGNAWLEFAHVSNYLASPQFLACPADLETGRVARDFSNHPEGGLLHFSFRANAVSYLLGLDALPSFPKAWVSGDRNLRVDTLNQGCSSGINNASAVRAAPLDSVSAWTNGVHGSQGNILLYDGHVSRLSNSQLRTASATADENGNIHLLMPR